MGFLQRLLGGGGRKLEHPVFGGLLLIRAKHGAYWEGETQLAGRPLTLAIEAPGEAEPVPGQVAFFERYTQDPDLAFHKGEDLLIGEYEQSIDRALARLTPDTLPLVVELAGLPEKMRGFGHVKEANVAKAKARWAEIEALLAAGVAPVAGPVAASKDTAQQAA